MSKRAAHVKIKELKTDIAVIKDLEISCGRIFDETWTEPIGPTPFPSVTDLREWECSTADKMKVCFLFLGRPDRLKLQSFDHAF